MEGVETDTIRVNTSSNVDIKNSKADVVEPTVRVGYKNFHLKNSRVKNLKIDLDKIGHWTVTNCDIEEENLAESGSNHVQLPQNEASAMNWLPKKPDARLTVTLSGDTARIVFPQRSN